MRNIKRTVIALMATILVSAAAPSFASVGNSIAPEIMSQSKALASVISSRIQVLWSDFVDKQIDYTNDPDGADAPRWATEIELANLIGGEAPEGITFREVNMPAGRNDSFELEVTVGPQFGGAASARYIKAYMPTATVNGNVITVPVVRPAKALGLADMHLTEFTDVSRFEMAPNANIEMNEGDINGVNELNSRKIVTNDLEVTNMLQAHDGHFSGDVNIDGSLTVGQNGNNGHLYLGDNGYIHGGTNSDLTIGGSTNTSLLSKLIINAAKSQFKGNVEAEDITLIKNGVTTKIGSQDSSSFTIDSTMPILLSQSGTKIMELSNGEVNIEAPLAVHGDLLPSAHDTYNIGSSINSWKNIYASSLKSDSEIYFGKSNGNRYGYIDNSGLHIDGDINADEDIYADGKVYSAGQELATQAFVRETIANEAIKAGSVVPFHNVRLSGRHPIFWGQTTPDTRWVVCDGGTDLNGGTVPNLSNKFIMGVTTEASANATGGANFQTLTVNNLPSHTHSASNLRTSTSGAHYHGAMGENSGSSLYGIYAWGNYCGSNGGLDWDNNIMRTSTNGAHSHTISGTLDYTGGGQAFDNRPSFYSLIYLVKLPN